MDHTWIPGGPRHDLIVGGTGMLSSLCLELAGRGDAVSVVARQQNRLRRLERQSADRTGRIHGLEVDYREDDAFYAALVDAQRVRGPFDLAVCWIHAAAPSAPDVVARSLRRETGSCRYFHVIGSVQEDPLVAASRHRGAFARYGWLRYHQVVLGFTRQGGSSRWLTDGEISTGVLRAIDLDAKCHVVGTVEPWDRRP